MGIKIKPVLAATVLVGAALTGSHEAVAQSQSPGLGTEMERYSQETLLKNWALSVCLGIVNKDQRDKDDAGETASAYLEFGRQPLEAYGEIRELVKTYAARNYGGSIESEFNTMKCIDLFHSGQLDRLVGKWVTSGGGKSSEKK